MRRVTVHVKQLERMSSIEDRRLPGEGGEGDFLSSGVSCFCHKGAQDGTAIIIPIPKVISITLSSD